LIPAARGRHRYRPRGSHTHRTTMRFCLPAVGLLGLLALGCGPSAPPTGGLDMGGPDANKVATLVEDMNEAKGDAKKTAALFVAGVRPETKKLAQFDYSIVGKPVINGTDATCKVRADKAPTGEKAGEVEWAFVKEGDKWKIKSAPLP
jgi:hypothetical protein